MHTHSVGVILISDRLIIEMAHLWSLKSNKNPVFFGLNKPLKKDFLPKNSDVLKCILHYQNECGSKTEVYDKVATDIEAIWHSKTLISTIEHRSVIKKLDRLQQSYTKLLKSMKQSYFESNRQQFKAEHELKLFDISTCKCEDNCLCNSRLSLESKQLLENQKSSKPNALTVLPQRSRNKTDNNNKKTTISKSSDSETSKSKILDSAGFVESVSNSSQSTENERKLRARAPLTPMPIKRPNCMKNVAMMAVRHGWSNRQTADMANSTLKDFGIATENTIIDRHTVARAKSKVTKEIAKDHMADLAKFISETKCYGLFLDDKKDQTITIEQNTETERFHPRKVLENHCTLVIQPLDQFLSYIPTKGSTSDDIFVRIKQKFDENKFDFRNLLIVGSDAAATNTGKHNGNFKKKFINCCHVIFTRF